MFGKSSTEPNFKLNLLRLEMQALHSIKNVKICDLYNNLIFKSIVSLYIKYVNFVLLCSICTILYSIGIYIGY
jgi:hypothetical protein